MKFWLSVTSIDANNIYMYNIATSGNAAFIFEILWFLKHIYIKTKNDITPKIPYCVSISIKPFCVFGAPINSIQTSNVLPCPYPVKMCPGKISATLL